MSDIIVLSDDDDDDDDAPTPIKREQSSRTTVKSENRDSERDFLRKRRRSLSTATDLTSDQSVRGHGTESTRPPHPKVKSEHIDLDDYDTPHMNVNKRIKLEEDVDMTRDDEEMSLAAMEEKARELAREIERKKIELQGRGKR